MLYVALSWYRWLLEWAAQQACKVAGHLWALCWAKCTGIVTTSWFFVACVALILGCFTLLVWDACYIIWTKAKFSRSLHGQQGGSSHKRSLYSADFSRTQCHQMVYMESSTMPQQQKPKLRTTAQVIKVSSMAALNRSQCVWIYGVVCNNTVQV